MCTLCIFPGHVRSGVFIFLCITVLRLNNTFKRGTRDTGARVKSNSASFFSDIDSSFNKLLLQKEELEQKHLHLLQIVESEKTAKWQYTQQCEELASEIKKLRAEVKYQPCFIYNIYLMIFSSVILFRVSRVFLFQLYCDYILLLRYE